MQASPTTDPNETWPMTEAEYLAFEDESAFKQVTPKNLRKAQKAILKVFLVLFHQK